MNKTLLVGAALALCSPALAQSYVTTPKGGLAKEGPNFAYILGWLANGRFQMADGTHKGNAFSLKRLSFRLDNRHHTSLTATGRTWTNITLDISETSKFDQMSQVWTANITSTPTTAFSSKWSWPGQTGMPVLKPDVWGGRRGQISFPFAKPWLYTGKQDILMDYKFRGGTLANNGTWSGLFGSPFYLDSENLNTFANIGGYNRMPAILSQCADSSATFANATAITFGYAVAYGTAVNTSLKNKVQLTVYSYFTAPNATVIHALGLGANKNGVAVGARCNKLYVDLAKPTILMTARASGVFGLSGLRSWAFPWKKEFAGQELYTQGAWADSKTGAFSLTDGTHLTVPNSLPSTTPQRYKTHYNHDLNSTQSLFIPITSGFYFPYTQYQIK